MPTPSTTTDVVNAELRRAQELAHLRRHGDARQILLRLLSLAPDDIRVWCQFAALQSHLGLHVDALAAADRAVSLAPDNEWGHRLRCLYLQNLGRNVEAVATGVEACRLAPQSVRALNALCQAYRATGEHRAAEACVVHMRALAPDAQMTINAAVHTAMARKDWDEAELRCLEARRQFPEEPAFWSNLGVIVRQQGRIREAISYFQEALRLNGGDDFARRNLILAIQSVVRTDRDAVPKELSRWAGREMRKLCWTVFQRRLMQWRGPWRKRTSSGRDAVSTGVRPDRPG
jgi:tetratricopeptide (TPR) repeat protein